MRSTTMLTVDRLIAAAPEVVWSLLVDLSAWPTWGPTVRRAELDDPVFARGATGRVWTVAGVSAPFMITELEPGRSWAWTVGGVRATRHLVQPVGDGCRVTFGVPWWAPAYLPVCAIALQRLARLV